MEPLVCPSIRRSRQLSASRSTAPRSILLQPALFLPAPRRRSCLERSVAREWLRRSFRKLHLRSIPCSPPPLQQRSRILRGMRSPGTLYGASEPLLVQRRQASSPSYPLLEQRLCPSTKLLPPPSVRR